MKNKLKLEHLAPYLHYALKGVLLHDMKEDFSECDWVEDYSIFEKGSIWQYAGYADKDLSIPLGEGDFSGFLVRNGNSYTSIGKSIKPLLLPLEYLTKEIEHNGKKFVPMLELARIADIEFEDFNTDVKDNGKIFAIKYTDKMGVDINFAYRSETKSFNSLLQYEKQVCSTSNQFELFQKLQEWHFDYQGLIKNNLALDKTKHQ